MDILKYVFLMLMEGGCCVQYSWSQLVSEAEVLIYFVKFDLFHDNTPLLQAQRLQNLLKACVICWNCSIASDII